MLHRQRELLKASIAHHKNIQDVLYTERTRKYTERPAGFKLFPFAENLYLITTFDLSP